MIKVLFVCIHNSARSQIAEELLRLKLGDAIHVESAGLEPGELNPMVIDVLKSIGVDISNKKTKNVFDLQKKQARFNFVITVCDDASGERCPIFLGALKHLHWSFPDPSFFEGPYQDKFDNICKLMGLIDAKINDFIVSLEQFSKKQVQQATKLRRCW